MSTYESDLFRQAKTVIESCSGLRQVMTILPKDCELSVVLDQRLPCKLKLENEALVLLPETSHQADFQIDLHTESIRRLGANTFETVSSLVPELFEQFTLGYFKFKVLTSAADLQKKGYFDAFGQLAPDLQQKITTLSITVMGQAQGFINKLTQLLRKEQ